MHERNKYSPPVLAELVIGCRRTTQIAPGLVRYRLANKLIKGQPLGGLDDE